MERLWLADQKPTAQPETAPVGEDGIEFDKAIAEWDRATDDRRFDAETGLQVDR